MDIVSALVLFLVYWFMIFFIFLPVQIKTQGDEGDVVPGTHASAPTVTFLRNKFIITTIVSLFLWVVTCTIIVFGWISIETIDIFDRFD
ncbi:MAG: DUF1467 family protein [Aestuariivita sp.]|nr:DUF1467 family protein [Aestuariivita sp.]